MTDFSPKGKTAQKKIGLFCPFFEYSLKIK